ncbi:UNKNOWN [Stylonychia lemnae]|uniref:Arrestin-like N-terminal domain-containing protein n=1 Tax=Stylonychia lemnae TaxID=5949 RepID=A0A078AVM1_STYLE|nr:UNKNOWN [Stylonychia lemnae]|eukprot:CDW86234.1 UNKNOWN [Stylonychia lemnae]
MGNIDSRAQFGNGYLQAACDQPFYEPGQTVTGKVYVRLINNIADAKCVQIKIRGKEKGSWWETFHRNVRYTDGRTVYQQVTEKRKSRKDFFSGSVSLHDFQAGASKGDYVFPFQFQLSENIPSSFFYKNSHIKKKPKAQVKYCIKASLETRSDHNEMQYKQVLIVREKPDQAVMEKIAKISEQKVTTWCCVNQGTSKIEVQFDKNTFFPYEQVKCKVELNNGKCNIPMTAVRFSVEQELSINCHNHIFRDLIVIKEKQENGAPARHDKNEERELEVDLSQIKYQVPAHRNKGGKHVQFSLEDAFQMSQAQPDCHGSIIKNDYYLAVRTVFDGCTCCAELPKVRIPLNILPVINPQLANFAPPNDYNPKDHEITKITFNKN